MCRCVCVCGKTASLGVVYGLVAFLHSAASKQHIPEREGRRREEKVRKKVEKKGKMEIKGTAERQRERRALEEDRIQRERSYKKRGRRETEEKWGM